MEPVTLSHEYLNALASHSILICTLLAGFSLAVIVNLLDNERTDSVMKAIFRAAIISASAFLVAIFAMTDILLMTTKGYPFSNTSADLDVPRLIGALSLNLGLFALTAIIILSGWAKSKRMGWFTTIIGSISLVLMIFAMS